MWYHIFNSYWVSISLWSAPSPVTGAERRGLRVLNANKWFSLVNIAYMDTAVGRNSSLAWESWLLSKQPFITLEWKQGPEFTKGSNIKHQINTTISQMRFIYLFYNFATPGETWAWGRSWILHLFPAFVWPFSATPPSPASRVQRQCSQSRVLVSAYSLEQSPGHNRHTPPSPAVQRSPSWLPRQGTRSCSSKNLWEKWITVKH